MKNVKANCIISEKLCDRFFFHDLSSFLPDEIFSMEVFKQNFCETPPLLYEILQNEWVTNLKLKQSSKQEWCHSLFPLFSELPFCLEKDRDLSFSHIECVVMESKWLSCTIHYKTHDIMGEKISYKKEHISVHWGYDVICAFFKFTFGWKTANNSRTTHRNWRQFISECLHLVIRTKDLGCSPPTGHKFGQNITGIFLEKLGQFLPVVGLSFVTDRPAFPRKNIPFAWCI